MCFTGANFGLLLLQTFNFDSTLGSFFAFGKVCKVFGSWVVQLYSLWIGSEKGRTSVQLKPNYTWPSLWALEPLHPTKFSLRSKQCSQFQIQLGKRGRVESSQFCVDFVFDVQVAGLVNMGTLWSSQTHWSSSWLIQQAPIRLAITAFKFLAKLFSDSSDPWSRLVLLFFWFTTDISVGDFDSRNACWIHTDIAMPRFTHLYRSE